MKTTLMRSRMGFCLWALGLSLGVPGANAQENSTGLPELVASAPGLREKLSLEEMELSVEVRGSVVETIWELAYFNHTSRRVEGEFSMRLPEGATISTYAIDIAGQMRDGASVESERALLAYEEIKRRQVDPGLLERKAGNIYRNRIFPIEPQKPKRVRIGYIQNLAATGPRTLKVEHQFHHPQAIKKARVNITGTDALSGVDLPGLLSNEREQGTWTGQNVALRGKIEVPVELPSVTRIHAERIPSGTTYFVAQARIEGGMDGWAKPKDLRLIWDASLTRRYQDHTRELEALDKLWEWTGDVNVRLDLVGHEVETANFEVRGGKCPKLRQRLSDVVYDGAADFSGLEGGDLPALVFTDADSVAGPKVLGGNFKARPLIVVTDGGRVSSFLAGLAHTHVDLQDGHWWAKLTGNHLPVEVEGLERESWNFTLNGDHCLVTGRIPKDHRDRVVIALPGLPRATVLSELARDKDRCFTRRVWAQEELGRLEATGTRSEITEFAKEERLASDYTSLIVLETMADYVAYRIPPSDDELLKIYTDLTRIHRVNARETLTESWERKTAWHTLDFPWLDERLHQESGTIGIWARASRQAFPETALSGRVASLEAWVRDARATVKRRANLESKQGLETWKKEVSQRIDELDKIRGGQGEEAGKPIHFSVQGQVNRRGILRSDQALTLMDGIEMAGGPYLTNLGRVFLYRDGQRTGYNTESLDFQDVDLRNGDMIVVERPLSADGLLGMRMDGFGGGNRIADDPFGGPSEDAFGGSGRRQEAMQEFNGSVIEEAGSFQALLDPAKARAIQPLGKDRNSPQREATADELAVPGVPTFGGLNSATVDKIRDSAEPAELYRELCAGAFTKEAPSVLTTIEMARVFFEKKDQAMGGRVLSNLIEMHVNKFEGWRAYALWLAEFGEAGLAVEHLQRLLSLTDEPDSRSLLSHDIAELLASQDKKETVDWQRKALDEQLRMPVPDALATVALTSYYGGKHAATQPWEGLAVNGLPSDIRVVVISAGAATNLFVAEPGGALPSESRGVSRFGGWSDGNDRVMEYQLRVSLPGSYRVACRRVREAGSGDDPVTLRVAYHYGWGTDRHRVEVKTVLLEESAVTFHDLKEEWKE